MKRIMFIYPGLTSYTMPVLEGLAEKAYLDVFYGIWDSNQGFPDIAPPDHPNIVWHPVRERHLFGSNRFGMYQQGLLTFLFRKRPDVVYLWANPRYLSFWLVLIVGYLLRIPVYTRGHGLFKKTQISFVHRWMYQVLARLSKQYICYTPAVKKSLLKIGVPDHKLAVDYNSMDVEHIVRPDEKTGQEPGVFYIGRVRQGCGVDVLIQAIAHLNSKEQLGITLHIIGDGLLGNYVREQAQQYAWISYYGKLYDQKRISQISKKCRIGCVPGFMGLNVVHMMALSLPVLTHGALERHMGPEPEYIRDQVNGWLVGYPANEKEITDALRQVWSMSVDEIKEIQAHAFETYIDLNTPPYHERLAEILLGENR